MPEPTIRKLARQLVSLDTRLKHLETVPQLSNSSIDDTGVPVYDADGNLVAQVGKQADGTWGAPPLNGPVPSAPAGVSFEGGPGVVNVTWTGDYVDGTAPLDFDTLEVLVAGTRAGALSNRSGGSLVVSAAEGSRVVSARVRTLVPRYSVETPGVVVQVGPPPDALFEEAKESIEAAQGEIQAAKDSIAAEIAAREAALADALDQLAQLDGKLDGMPDSAELDAVRQQVAAAQQAVQAAQADATAAQQAVQAAVEQAADAQAAADTANANALAAAGIAADKGRIFYQADAPTGEDRSPNNLWIDSDNGRVHVWNGTAWEESQSEDLRDAAQAAVAAQQAAEAADSKAQAAAAAAAAADAKAQAAQGAAETAQQAAATAQQTADQATLDARGAHNEAVAAQGAADEALAAYGPLDERTVAAQAAADAAQQRAEEAYGEAAAKATPAEVQAAADAAEQAATDAAALDAAAQAAQAKADALAGAAVTAQEKADAAQAAAEATAAQDAAGKADQALQAALDALATARSQITAEITTSANGKNAITVSTAAPTSSTPGAVAGDTWWRVDGSGNIFGQWSWTGTKWSARTINSEVIANLDVGKLSVTGSSRFTTAVVDRLFADIFAAHKITASQVVVSSGANLLVGANGEAEVWTSSAFTTYPDGGRNGGWSLVVPSGDTSLRGYYGGMSNIGEYGTPVTPGQKYRVSAWVRGSETGGSYGARIYARSYDTAGGSYTFASPAAFSSGPLVANEWTLMEETITIPETGTRLILGCYVYGYTGAVRFSDITVQQVSGAVLIEDGAISANKITIVGNPNDPDEAGLVANIASIMKLAVENLVVTEGAEINEAVILKLASEMITAGVLRTAEAGQRVVIDTSGIVMYGVDDDGVEYELVRIGPSGDNLITAGDTTISPAGVQAPSGEFDTLSVGGDDLSTILGHLPRGVVARGWNEVGNRSIGPSGETELGEITVPVENNRSYSLKVEPLSVYLPTGGRLALNIYIEKGFDGNPAPDPTRSSRLYRSTVWRDSGGDRPMIIVQGNWLAWEVENANEWRLLFTLSVWGSDSAGAVYNNSRPYSAALAVSVEDVGEFAEAVMTNRDGTTAAPKPPPPAPKRYTKTYDSTEFYTYNQSGSQYSSNTDVVQGLYAGGSSGSRRRGGWKFPSFTNDLSGATVEKIEMYIYMNHSYYTAGATVNVATHNGNISNSLSDFRQITGWKRNTGRWITLPSSLYNGFKNGSYQGVGVISTNSYAEQYARFNGPGAKIRITYVK